MDPRNKPPSEKRIVIYPGVTLVEARRVLDYFISERWDLIKDKMPYFGDKPVLPGLEYRQYGCYYKLNGKIIEVYPTLIQFVIRRQAPDVDVVEINSEDKE